MNPTLNARGGINKQSAREAAGLTASGATGQSGALEIPTISPITPESLQTPVAPVTIPKPSSTAQSYMDSLAASASSTTDLTSAEQQLNQKAQQSQNLSDLAFEDRINYMLNAPTKEAITAEQYAASGVDKKAALATSYGTQILAEQKALNNQVKEIEKNAEGRTAQGITIETNKAKSESLSRQADLAILQKVAIDDYTAAKVEADRYIDAKYSLVERNLDIFDEIYQKYEATATKDEARAFEEAQFNRRQKAQDAREDEKTLQSVKLDAMRMAQANGAPVSVLSAIQNAQTPEEVISKGGQWGSVDMLDRALKSEQLKSLRTKPAALAPTQVIDQGGRKLLVNTQTGEVIKDFGETDMSVDELQKATQVEKISQIDSLISNPALGASVGPNFLARGSWVSIPQTAGGGVSNFTASIDQLTKNMTLDTLIQAKANGATFGALSEGELRLLSDSATKINNWRIEKDGRTVGYDANQKDFLNELDKISRFSKLDALNRGADPKTIGVTQTVDGKYWTQDSSGNFVLVK